MNNDDLDKQLSDAMGDSEPEKTEPKVVEPASTSKRTLKGAMVAKAEVSEPKEMSREELKLTLKLEILQELLADQMATGKALKKADAKVAVDLPPEEEVMFRVNLPAQAQNLRINGNEYYHGHTYKVKKSMADGMRDVQFRAWQHDEQVRGYRPFADGYRTSDMSINSDGQAISRPIY